MRNSFMGCAVRFVAGIVGVAVVLGCGEADELPLLEDMQEEQGTWAPESFIDEQGRQWNRTGAEPVTYSDEEPKPPDDQNPSVPVKEMSFEDAVEALRPIRLVGDYEYTLADEDAVAFATEILEYARTNNDEGDADSSGPVTSTGKVLPSQEDGVLVGKAIYDGESRSNIDSLRGSWPFIATARMTATGACSAFKVGNHGTAATAAHCVHNGSSWITPSTLNFGNQPQAPAGCYGVTVPGCWDGDDASCDYASLALSGGGTGGVCPANTFDVGYLGFNTPSSSVDDIKAHLAGYPGTPPYGWPYTTMVYDYRENGWTSVAYPERVFYYTDTSGGQSGASLTSYFSSGGYKSRAIHKEGDQGIVFETNAGRKFTLSLYTWIYNNGGYL